MHNLVMNPIASKYDVKGCIQMFVVKNKVNQNFRIKVFVFRQKLIKMKIGTKNTCR
jgi:hypothetical protein